MRSLKPDGVQFRRGPLEGVAHAGKFQRHGDVFERGHVGDEVEGLEHDADIAAAKGGQLVLVHSAEFAAGDRNAAPVGALQSGNDHQKRRLARAGGTENGNRFAAGHRKRDIVENMDAGGTLAERQVNAVKGDDIVLRLVRRSFRRWHGLA